MRAKEVVREVVMSSNSRRMKKCMRYISYCCDKVPHASTSRIKGLFSLVFSKVGKGMVAGVGGSWSRGIHSQEAERQVLVLRSLSPLTQSRTPFPHPGRIFAPHQSLSRNSFIDTLRCVCPW